MRWAKNAEEAIVKVPFFVRRRVKKKVEEEAERQHASQVTLEHVRTCQKKFLKNMEDEIKGHQLESCFGGSGCPNRIPTENDLSAILEDMLRSRGLKAFLKSRVNGPRYCQLCRAIFWRHASHWNDCPHRYQCAKWRYHTNGRSYPCPNFITHHFICCTFSAKYSAWLFGSHLDVCSMEYGRMA